MTARLYQNEQGRSLTEMLGVLAVIGILTITAVAGYRYAVDKSQANTIAKDARAIYTVFHGNANVGDEFYEDFIDTADAVPDYRPMCGKQMWIRRSNNGFDFVAVDDVAKGVCNRLLDMRGAQVEFYDMDGFRFEECTNENNMVFGFNGTSFKQSCNTVANCGAGFNGYCHEKGLCMECGEGYKGDPSGTKCIADCNPETETLCTSGEEGWCCINTEVCDYENKTCAEPTGKCVAYLGPTPETEAKYITQCSATVPETPEMEAKYITECSFTVNTTGPEYTSVDSGNGTSYTFNDIEVSQERDDMKCKAGQYCALFWANKETVIPTALSTIQATSTGKIYGRCEPYTDYDSTPVMSLEPVDIEVEPTGCSKNEYYALFWTDSAKVVPNALGNIQATSKGTIYGRCEPYTDYDSTPVMSVEPTDIEIEPTGCGENEYCVLLWTDSEKVVPNALGNIQATSKGTIYGRCEPYTDYDSTPVMSAEPADIDIEMKTGCLPNEYCYLGWSNAMCTQISASSTGELYGMCILNTQNSATCQK